MSAPVSPTLASGSASATSAGAGAPRLSAAEIDASCRWPLLVLFLSAIGWLVGGTVLALIASIKLHGPGFLAGCEWLTLGRVRPAAMNALLYGFASQAAMGVLLWQFCRLGNVRLLFPGPIIIAGNFWNLGVTVGVVAILAGESTGFEWLEMPRYAAGILFAAYAVIGICAAATFHLRRERALYVTQWYLLAALFWFPWVYSAANCLLALDPVRGALQAAVNAWFTNNLLGLWLTPVCLGSWFYFVPKLLNRPLHSRELAVFGFWTLAIFTNWSGLTQLTGGPLPRWMPAASVAANVLLLVPIIATGMNWRLTMLGQCAKIRENMVLRFVTFGGGCYLVGGLASVIIGLREVSAVTQFTYVPVAVKQLALHGFVGMVLFGCLYYILPRLLQTEWPKPRLIRAHYLCSTIGVALLFVPLAIGGVFQGLKLNDPAVPFVALAKSTIPWVGLHTLGLIVLLAGQFAFLSNLAGLLRGWCANHCAWMCELCCGGDANGGGKR